MSIFEKYLEEQGSIIDRKDLGVLSEYAAQLKALNADLESCEEAMTKIKETIRDIETRKLPDVMMELGLDSFVTSDGDKLEIVTEYGCSIPAAKRSDAYKWLADNDHDIVKTTVSTGFAKGCMDDALNLRQVIHNAGFDCALVNEVHHSTLRSWFRSMDEENLADTIPSDLFTKYVGPRAKIKKVK